MVCLREALFEAIWSISSWMLVYVRAAGVRFFDASVGESTFILRILLARIFVMFDLGFDQ